MDTKIVLPPLNHLKNIFTILTNIFTDIGKC